MRIEPPCRWAGVLLSAWALACLIGWSAARAASVGREQRPAFALVVDGRAACAVVLARTPTKAARFAAWELRQHVKRITGAELPMVDDAGPVTGRAVLVGESRATRKLGLTNDGFASQEYLIRIGRDRLVLMGRDASDTGKLELDYLANPYAVGTWPSVYDEQGTMYAVYDFLRDDCGVRWFSPTDAGTVVPKRKTLVVAGRELRRKPFMWYRGGLAGTDCAERIQWGGGLWRRGTPEGAKYMAMAYGTLYARHENENQRLHGVRAQNRRFMYRMKAGGDLAPCNHSFYTYYEQYWTKGHANFVAHRPELFAQGYHGEQPPQMCYTSEAFLQQLLRDIRDYFDHGGYRKRMSTVAAPGHKWGRNYFALEPMDNASFCQCPKCTPQFELDRPRAERHSTYWFRFVNRVARAIKQTHPDKKITTLAYMTHEGLPTGLRLEDNVIVYFCISANRMPYSPSLDRQMRLLEKWHKHQDVPMSLWLYHTFPLEIANNGRFYCFPGFFAHALDKQFKTFQRYKINGIFHCGFHGEVENYVSYRLMDDPSLDVDALLDEYFAHYGAAGDAIRAFYTLIERRYCDPKHYPKQGDRPYGGHQNVRIAWKHLGTPAVMEQLARHMAEAHRRAATPAEKLRVALWDQAVYQYMRTGHETFRTRMAAPIPSVVAKRVPAAQGDPRKVDWSKAGSLGDTFYVRGSDIPIAFKMEGRIGHDGQHLYIELTDHGDPKKLHVAPGIACYDDWEIMLARRRSQPFRQYLVGPTAMTMGLSYGEVNWRQGVRASEHGKKAFGLRAASDTSGTAWVLRLAFPLDEMMDKPVAPGDTFYMNLIRVRGPAQTGGRFAIETWVSYMTVKEVDRAGSVTLEK